MHEVIVIGAGIAGATAAAHVAQHRRTLLLEAEAAPGMHSTGRSAAFWHQNYGPPDVRALTVASRPFFEDPPDGFADTPLMTRRASAWVCRDGDEAAFAAMMADGQGLEEIAPAALRSMVPALRDGYASRAAIEELAFDMDVDAIHQGFLRMLRGRGGGLAVRSRAGRIARQDGIWTADLSDGTQARAPILVNAAGAWADEVAVAAGVAPLGLTPCRRTGIIVDAAPYAPAAWPMVSDVPMTWYCRPEAGGRLMVTPADQTPTTPHDVQPEELDVAIGVDRMQQALDIEVRRVVRAWAGLRTFTPDGSLAIGWAPDADGFFWCAGQGGYGIQTSPAAGRLVADMIEGVFPELDMAPAALSLALASVDPGRFGRERAS